MLRSLFIQNFVLIDSLDIRFNNGLAVMTGETGAGKSIIIGALSLVLGQRADGKSIQPGKEKCVIEAFFDISSYQLEAFFLNNDLEYDAKDCILRRELSASGKSRAFVNDTPVSLAILKELGSQLIDIHSQHQNLLLGDDRFQLKVIDVMADNGKLLASYREKYASYQSLKKEKELLLDEAQRAKQEEDYFRFQLTQLEEARLESSEQEELEQEQETLSHAEEIKANLFKITELLNGDQTNGLQIIKEALTTADGLERYFPKAEEIAERIRSAYIDLNDLVSETNALQEKMEYDPKRLDWVNERLDLIYSLQKKHHVSTVDELIALQKDYTQKLNKINAFDEEIERLTKQTDNLYKDLFQQGKELSERRKKAALQIAKLLEQKVAPLGMPNAQFRIDFMTKEIPGNDGVDEITFLFSANKNVALQPVGQIASGGEISRLMLCIKAMIAGSMALPTIIFDEVDAGVSGDIADKMGNIMQELGEKMQVITITHLPQVAAKGNTHYYVYKEETADKTITRIKELNTDERIKEVARMLSGASLTEAALANARELLNY
ncbi:DNA repair protein RecN [Parabacteroides sp. OttesenSCG-928-G07]|nr:DNA repair protein RecN [Parabacteroides sp. OttesenSCG-928-G21]MDL2278034.1 DNA repair protein RecN [Parabacteroides sp. OttesenSCG-928-G07]